MKKYTASYSSVKDNFAIINNDGSYKYNDKYYGLYCVVQNIIQRGKPSIPSLYLQDVLEELDVTRNRALYLVSNDVPEWNLIKGDDSEVYFPAEHFYYDLLPKYLGEANIVRNLIIPEVDFKDVLKKSTVLDGQQVDFFFPQLKTVIEIDGSSHKQSSQEMKDGIRDEALKKADITVLRISTEDIKNESASFVSQMTELKQAVEEACIVQNLYTADNCQEYVLELKYEAIIRLEILLLELLKTGRLTAMKALGQDRIQIYFNSDRKITDKKYIDLAVESGLISREELQNSLSEKECENILEKLNTLSFGEWYKDDLERVEYKKNVIEIPTDSILEHDNDYLEIAVTNDILSSIKIGKYIIAENNEGIKVARKIIEVNNNKVILSDKVELEDVINSLVVSDIREVSIEDIIKYYGLTPDDEIAKGIDEKDRLQGNLYNFVSDYNSKGFTFTFYSTESNGKKLLGISIMDNATKIKYKLPINIELNDDNEYEAKLDIDKILLASQVKYTAQTGIKYSNVAFDTHSTIESGFKLNKEEKIPLCEIPISLVEGVVSADVHIYIMISAEGNISVRAEMPLVTSIQYEQGKGIRNFKQEITLEKPEVKVDCKANLMLRVEPIISILRIKNILDVEADIGAVANAETTKHDNLQICTDANVDYPVIELAVGDDKKAKSIITQALKLSCKWDIVKPEEAMFQFNIHHEILPDGKIQFVDKCTYDDSIVNETEKLGMKLESFYGYNLPLSFWLDNTYGENDTNIFSIKDEGNYYLVKGTLYVPECIETYIAYNTQIGDSFTTGSGKCYLVTNRESYNDDQRERIDLCDAEGNNYVIQNIPASRIDMYTDEMYYVIQSSDEENINYTTAFKVALKISDQTRFSDGKTFGKTFEESVINGAFTDIDYNIGYDIHFTKDGNIDILTGAEPGSNGPWGGSNTEIFEGIFE